MEPLFTLTGARKRDPTIEAWLSAHPDILRGMARQWFDVIRQCGPDVLEIMHDGYPTACIGEAAFAYVGTFKAHVNVGFFRGAELEDPAGLLEGSGKLMRHVKLRPEKAVDESALTRLIQTAYQDMRARQA